MKQRTPLISGGLRRVPAVDILYVRERATFIGRADIEWKLTGLAAVIDQPLADVELLLGDGATVLENISPSA